MTEIDPKLSRLYREASTESPPEVVDAAILAAARKRAAQSQRSEGSQRRERSLWSHWIAPAGAIATLVLGVSIALLVEREQPGTVGGTSVRPVPPRPQSWPPAPVTESAKPENADSAAPEAAAKKEAPEGRAPASPAPAPAATLPAPEPVQRPAESTPSAMEAFPAESRAKAAAPKAATESNAGGDAATGGLAAGAPSAPAAAGELAPMRQQAIQRSPEVWLDEIGRLKREGREKEAAEQLAEFRKAYPAHAVPENLLK